MAILAGMVLAGCSSTETGAVRDVAEGFSRNPSCAALAPDTAAKVADEGGGECRAGLEQAGLPHTGVVRRVEVAGHSAEVDLGDQVVFLARFDTGWKVTAAGCHRVSADQAVPYDCAVTGA